VFGLSDSREGTRFCYDRRALVQPGQHSVDRYLSMVRLAGADTSGSIQFPLPCGKAVRSLEMPERFVVLHPFARGAGKSLTPEEIFEFTRLLVPVPVVVVGRSRMPFKTDRKCLSLVNQTDLAELIWLLRQSSFIVSVDSGPMHIAAAITPEVLSIHTWSDPGAVGPYNPEAWIWKAKRIYQVRSNRRGESWKASEERPDICQIANFVRARLLH
jgi:heptosyltransferase I